MKVDVTTSRGWVTVKVIGRIDNFTYPILENDVSILLSAGTKNMIFDMSEATHISMSFIRLMKKTQERLHLSDGRLVLNSMKIDLKRKLENFMKPDSKDE